MKITRGTKKTTSSLDRSGCQLSCEPIQAVRVSCRPFSNEWFLSRLDVSRGQSKPRLVFSRIIGPGPVLSKWKRVLFDLITHFVYSSHFSLLPPDLLYFKSVAVLMYDVSNNTLPPQISNLFNYQHNIHSHNTRSSTRGNFFLEYSRLDKLNMSFSRNGVRVWNNLSNEIRQMPKVKFKRNIHNMLLQKLSEANEYIDLLDLNMS